MGTSDSTTDSQENKPGIRLVGGRNEYEGRVEVHHEGQWKTVCDRSWGQNEAQVVCRQLGYQKPSNGSLIIIIL